MKNIYVAGPMSGYQDFNFPAFHAAAAALRAQGYTVLNPAELNGGADELVACAAMNAEQLAEHWASCMRRDIAALVTCDGIHMLPGWERSKGAAIEFNIASLLRLEVSFAAGARSTDWAMFIYRETLATIEKAAWAGFVITVAQQPKQPLAMGHHDTVVDVRPKREMA